MARYFVKTFIKRTLYGLAAVIVLALIIAGSDILGFRLKLPAEENCAFTVFYYGGESAYPTSYSMKITDQNDIDSLYAFAKSLTKTSFEIPHGGLAVTYSVLINTDNGGSFTISLSLDNEPGMTEKLQVCVTEPQGRRLLPVYWYYQATDENLYNAARAIIVRYHEEMLAAGPIPKE